MKPYLDDGDVALYVGDARDVLLELPEKSFHAALTSPPFFGLRDYGTGRWEGGDPECDHVEERGPNAKNARMNERLGRPTGTQKQERMKEMRYRGVCARCGATSFDPQIGLEQTPEEWVEALVEVFAGVRRVLRDDGSLWIECGDSFSAGSRGNYAGDGDRPQTKDVRTQVAQTKGGTPRSYPSRPLTDVPAKNLFGMPWRLAFGLQADGWILRGVYVWDKPDAMPESTKDRCTISHSYLLHLVKKPRYYFDLDAIREPFSDYGDRSNGDSPAGQLDLDGVEQEPEQRGADGRRVTTRTTGGLGHDNYQTLDHEDGRERWPHPAGRSPRSVWRITTEATSFGLCPVCRAFWDRKAPETHCGVEVVSHFAAWPHELVRRIIACASPEGGLVLDPFGGSGTTGRQARAMGRRAVLIELNPDYAEIASHRLAQLGLVAG